MVICLHNGELSEYGGEKKEPSIATERQAA